MKAKNSSLDTEWKIMDVRNFKFPNNSVDQAIDKGTLNAMIHGSMWNPLDDVQDNHTL